MIQTILSNAKSQLHNTTTGGCENQQVTETSYSIQITQRG